MAELLTKLLAKHFVKLLAKPRVKHIAGFAFGGAVSGAIGGESGDGLRSRPAVLSAPSAGRLVLSIGGASCGECM